MSDWIIVSPTSGHGNLQIIITADTLSSLEDRVATIIASNSQYSLSASTLITQKGVPPTAITFENVTWVYDIPASGGTATKYNCAYQVYFKYADGTFVDITNIATVSGSLNVEQSQQTVRHSAGTLTLTATCDGLTGATSVTVYQEPAAKFIRNITFDNLTWATDIPASGGTATKDNCSYTIVGHYTDGTTGDVTTLSTVSGNLQVNQNYAVERHSAGTLTLSAEYINEYAQTLTCTGDVIAYQSILQSEIDSIDLYGLMWLTDVPWSGGTANSANCAFDVDLVLKYGNIIDIENYATISGSLTLGATSEELRTTAGTLTLTAQYSGFTDSENVDVWQQGLLCGVTVENIVYYGSVIPVSGGTINNNDFTCEVIAHYWNGTTLDVTQYASISYDSIMPEDDDETACITQYDNKIITITATYKGFEGTGDLIVPQEVSPYRRYLKIIAKESGVLTFVDEDLGLYMSLDSGSTWINTYNQQYNNISNGQEVYFRGGGFDGGYGVFSTDFTFDAEGNAFSLFLNDRPNRKDLSNYSHADCSDFFRNCTGLTDASRVLFTKVEKVLHSVNLSGLFFGCANMVSAPEELYFKNIVSGYGALCYYMFANCTSLTTAPDLYFNNIYSTNVSNDHGCEGMFSGCTSLTTVPVFEVNNIQASGCTNMFRGCTALTDVCDLHFNNVGRVACDSMFRDCTSLTSMPTITASEVSEYAFQYMFRNCSSLLSARVPNIYGSGGIFNRMFLNCSNLRYIEYLAIPERINDVIGTEWVDGVSTTGVFVKSPSENSWVIGVNGIPSGWAVEDYSANITGISINNLTWVNDIPASGGTGDSANCSYTIIGYYDNGISRDITSSSTVSGSLVVSATTATTRQNVGTLTLTASYFDVSTTGSVTAYQEGVGVTGISFDNLTWVTDIPASGGTGDSANCSYSIYANYNDGTSVDVTSISTVSGSLVVSATTATTRQNVGTLTLTAQYSGFTTTGDVTAYQEAFVPTPEETYLTFDIVSGGTIKWKASYGSISKTISYSKDNGATWTDITSTTAGATIYVDAGDKVMFKGDNSNYANNENYYNSFSNSSAKFNIYGNIMSLIDSTGFVTATTLTSDFTFCNLFGYCSGLLSAENLILPATTLTDNCYKQMFWGDSSLEKGPISIGTSATTMASGACMQMFQSCSGLTTAPKLPSTNLANMCYYQMFSSCRALNIAPDLPSTTLVPYCYGWMFYSCKSLQYIKCLATDISAEGCTGVWTEDVSPTGTFVKPASMNDWSTGNRGIPNGWTIQNIT